MVDRYFCLAALGLINALGNNVADIRRRLLAGDTSRLIRREDLIPGQRVLVAQVLEDLPAIPPALARFACRNNALLLAAYRQIEGEVQTALDTFGPARLGLILGSSTSGIAAAEEAIAQHLSQGTFPTAYHYRQNEMGSPAAFLADLTGITGPAYTISTACSSSAKGFATAQSLLEMDLCDAVVVGGADSLCKLTLNGFSALSALADDRCNPMSRHRHGITIGEGAALFLLTRQRGGIQLLGVGESCDAYHMSAPDPEGRGAETAMRRALENAALSPPQIAYLHLHGTGTLLNDAAESRAIARLFGVNLPCSSIKPLIGHTLGAAGVMGIAACWLVLTQQGLTLPPHVWDSALDEQLPQLHLVQAGESLCADTRPALLSNALAFGGNNCSVIIA